MLADVRRHCQLRKDRAIGILSESRLYPSNPCHRIVKSALSSFSHTCVPAKMPRMPSYVIGVGLTKFIKPRGLVDYPELGFEAGIKAMVDAGINYDQVDQGIACYCYGDSTCGQRVFYQFGKP